MNNFGLRISDCEFVDVELLSGGVQVRLHSPQSRKDRRVRYVFDLVAGDHQIKRSKSVGLTCGRRPRVFVESVSPDSKKKTFLLCELRASNEFLLERVGGES